MRYLSTRGGMSPASFSDVLIQGLAPDGGLVVPEAYPRVTPAELATWRSYSYPQLAGAVLARFAPDIPPASLEALVRDTYTAERFGSEAITPVKPLEDGVFLLALSNGPTLAFKDLAMQLLGQLFEYVLAQRDEHLNILGATSGDTGSAAEYAMAHKQRLQVFMLSPHGRMSPFQTAQMYALQADNIHNLAVDGVFDQCQDVVKEVNADGAFKTRYRISAVNSINWARVVAQVVYYFKGYFAVTEGNDQEVAFAVPSGNFGNIFAGHIARQMGLPIAQLILATNENNVLDEFFRTKCYRVRRGSEVLNTSSPSMDIAKASNFERFIYDVAQGDAERVADLWRQVAQGGYFDLRDDPLGVAVDRYGLTSGQSSHAQRLETIRWVHRRHGLVIDPHTADGLKVGLEQRRPGIPLLCLETALPAKFATIIQEALGFEPERPEAYRDIEAKPQRFVSMAVDAEAVKDYIRRQDVG
ncbi:MAG: threonine synthase [Candidatus Competibacterales bacterium]